MKSKSRKALKNSDLDSGQTTEESITELTTLKNLREEIIRDNTSIINALIADRLQSKKLASQQKDIGATTPCTSEFTTPAVSKTSDKSRDQSDSDDSTCKEETTHETLSSSSSDP